MYTKTRGHHCWWLNKNGKALANFDDESDVDEIIKMQNLIVLAKKIRALEVELGADWYYE